MAGIHTNEIPWSTVFSEELWKTEKGRSHALQQVDARRSSKKGVLVCDLKMLLEASNIQSQ
jgi:hypothetical protein